MEFVATVNLTFYPGSKESDYPISLKPALARSASKRRENLVAASRELAKTEDAVYYSSVRLFCFWNGIASL